MNNYEEFNSLNESNTEPKFKVGDNIKIKDKFLTLLKLYKDPRCLFLFNEIYIIEKISHGDFFSDFYECKLKGIPFYLNENVLDLVESEESTMKTRWYKKGKLE
jgi:hypothetical protein